MQYINFTKLYQMNYYKCELRLRISKIDLYHVILIKKNRNTMNKMT